MSKNSNDWHIHSHEQEQPYRANTQYPQLRQRKRFEKQTDANFQTVEDFKLLVQQKRVPILQESETYFYPVEKPTTAAKQRSFRAIENEGVQKGWRQFIKSGSQDRTTNKSENMQKTGHQFYSQYCSNEHIMRSGSLDLQQQSATQLHYYNQENNKFGSIHRANSQNLQWRAHSLHEPSSELSEDEFYNFKVAKVRSVAKPYTSENQKREPAPQLKLKKFADFVQPIQTQKSKSSFRTVQNSGARDLFSSQLINRKSRESSFESSLLAKSQLNIKVEVPGVQSNLEPRAKLMQSKQSALEKASKQYLKKFQSNQPNQVNSQKQNRKKETNSSPLSDRMQKSQLLFETLQNKFSLPVAEPPIKKFKSKLEPLFQENKAKIIGNAKKRCLSPKIASLELEKPIKDYRSALAKVNLKQLLKQCDCELQRQFIQRASNRLYNAINNSKVCNKKVENSQPTLPNETLSTESDDSESIKLPEEGGILLKEVNLSEELMIKFIKLVERKLFSLSTRRWYDFANMEYRQVINNLDIKKINTQYFLEKKRQDRTRGQILGEPVEQELQVLERIYLLTEKRLGEQLDEEKPLRNYVAILNGKTEAHEIHKRLSLKELRTMKTILPRDLRPKKERPASPQIDKIKKGFILFPNEDFQVGVWNPEAKIVDPSWLFLTYLQRYEERHQQYGKEFLEHLECQRLSSIYNLNSTIYEIQPTAKVAFMNSCKKEFELSLPLFAKIKNKELVLNQYRLDPMHFRAMKEAFLIEPDLCTKIVLNDCGVTEEGFVEMVNALSVLTRIQAIHLSQFSMDHRAIGQLGELFARPKKLESLVLKNFKLTTEAADQLFNKMLTSCYLTEFVLSNVEMPSTSFQLFAKFLSEDYQLQKLTLQSIKGLIPQNWLKFFEVIAHNKVLKELNISDNQFIENQAQAERQRLNPYNQYKEIYKKWKRMGAGARWPGENAIKRRKSMSIQTNIKTKDDRQILDVPDFQAKQPAHWELLDEREKEFERQKESFREIMKEQNQIVVKMLSKALKEEMEQVKNESQEKIHLSESKKVDDDLNEIVSTQAMVVTEAIYKLLRRNQKIQHLVLERCNLSQVMIGRIALGAKCSKSLLSIHFDDNPGITAELKAFLFTKLKAVLPHQENKIKNSIIENTKLAKEELLSQINELSNEQSLVYETILLKEMKQQLQQSKIPDVLQHSKLSFTRLLGCKAFIPGSNIWVMSTDQHPKECWVCEKHTFCLLFWHPKLSQIPDHDSIDKEALLKCVPPIKDNEVEAPLIQSSFTNWQAVPMIPLHQLSQIPRGENTPDILRMMVQRYNLPRNITQVIDLSPQELKLYQDLQTEYNTDYKINWRRYIGAQIQFQDAELINYEHVARNLIKEEELYVHVSLAKPGKHFYLVHKQSETASFCSEYSEQNTYESCLYKTMVPVRSEELPLLQKKMKDIVIQRKFHHPTSVFRNWKPDTIIRQKVIIECDLEGMNVSKLVPTETDRENLTKLLIEEGGFLKSLHQELLSDHSVGYIQEEAFIQFYKQYKLSDEKIQQLKQASLDLIYTQVYSNNNKKKGICRAELFEALMRIARAKYIEGAPKGEEKPKVVDVFKRFIDVDLKSQGLQDQHAEVRLKSIWTVEVNDLLEANEKQLKQIFQSIMGKQRERKGISLSDCEMLINQWAGLNVSVKSLRRCYFYSKMTCINERESFADYQNLLFVEFLEFLCRIAFQGFEEQKGQQESQTQIEQLFFVVDKVCNAFNMKAKPVLEKVLLDSDADISDVEY